MNTDTRGWEPKNGRKHSSANREINALPEASFLIRVHRRSSAVLRLGLAKERPSEGFGRTRWNLNPAQTIRLRHSLLPGMATA